MVLKFLDPRLAHTKWQLQIRSVVRVEEPIREHQRRNTSLPDAQSQPSRCMT